MRNGRSAPFETPVEKTCNLPHLTSFLVLAILGVGSAFRDRKLERGKQAGVSPLQLSCKNLGKSLFEVSFFWQMRSLDIEISVVVIVSKMM